MQRPWIAHANGKHDVLLRSPNFTPLLISLASDRALLSHPVVLIDRAGGDECEWSTIGQMYGIHTGNQMKL